MGMNRNRLESSTSGEKMRSFALSAALTLVATTALGDEVPFATPPPAQLGQMDPSMLASLGDIMGATQLRHIKLWYAGKSGNWELVGYELDRIAESLRRAAVLYSNIPVEYVIAASKPLSEMRDAVATKDGKKFVRTYFELTQACNSCHAAGRVGFIRLQTPTSSPFSDEVYRNQK
jgi:hypothetical protein